MVTTCINASELIERIASSKSYIDVFPDLSKWQDEYKEYAKLIHPDRCSEVGAKDAISKLNRYKDELEKGKTHKDDAGVIKYTATDCIITGEPNILKQSNLGYTALMSLKEKMDIDFQRYMPISMRYDVVDAEGQIKIGLEKRALPLSSIGTLPQEHVNWILSRMLEFGAYLNERGYVHAGFNPESIYVEPINHGIKVISYYHMTKLGEKLTTASGRFLNFYPEHVKTDKIARPDIDIELAKRTAVYLLGDKSGIGTVLRKTHNQDFLDFINKRHEDPVEAFKEYRALLKKNFESKFIPLNI